MNEMERDWFVIYGGIHADITKTRSGSSFSKKDDKGCTTDDDQHPNDYVIASHIRD